MFTGPINSGMSGGPSVTANGDVAGVNVSKRLDGELVSFLVPARYAQQLLPRWRNRASRRRISSRWWPAAGAPDVMLLTSP
jgi:S1-C subfamily serine protease